MVTNDTLSDSFLSTELNERLMGLIFPLVYVLFKMLSMVLGTCLTVFVCVFFFFLDPWMYLIFTILNTIKNVDRNSLHVDLECLASIFDGENILQLWES